MPGLLDLVDDPQQLGLLSLGLRLMSTPGKFGTALGQAGMGALGDVQQARTAMEARKQDALRQQMLQMQLQQMQQAQLEAQRAREEAAAAKQARGSFLDSVDPNAGPAMPVSIPQAMRAGLGLQEIQALMPAKAENPFSKVDPKDFTPESVRKFAMTNNYSDLAPRTKVEFVDGRAVDPYATPVGTQIPQRAPVSNPFSDLLVTDPSGQLVPNKPLIDAKKQLVPPGVSVSYGAPVAGVDKNGNPVFFQPGKDGGAPAIVPGVRPANKLGEKQQNQVVGIDALGQAVDEYVSSLSNWKKADALNADKRAQIGTVYNNLMLQAKEAYNLGVLNGPDLQIMEAVVRNPLTIVGAVTSNEALAKQATDLKRIMNKIKANINKTPGSALETSAPGSPKFLGFEPQ